MIKPIDTDIGGRMRQLRGEQTQQQFAELLGIGRTTLINYEANTRVPDAELLIKLHILYGTQPLWLLTGWGGESSGVKLKPDEAALLDNYRNSPPDGQAAIKATSAAFAKPTKSLKKAG